MRAPGKVLARNKGEIDRRYANAIRMEFSEDAQGLRTSRRLWEQLEILESGPAVLKANLAAGESPIRETGGRAMGRARSV